MHIRVIDHHLTVKTTRPKERRVEDVRAVRGTHHDQPPIPGEPIHLDQDLVQRLLTLIITLPDPRATLTPSSVKLVNENDRRARLTRLTKQIPHPRRTTPDQRLQKISP